MSDGGSCSSSTKSSLLRSEIATNSANTSLSRSLRLPAGQALSGGRRTEWVPRGGVLRCVIEDGGGEDGSLPVIHMDDREFDWEEFGRPIRALRGLGDAIVFVPDDERNGTRRSSSGRRTTKGNEMSSEKVQIPSERPIYRSTCEGGKPWMTRRHMLISFTAALLLAPLAGSCG